MISPFRLLRAWIPFSHPPESPVRMKRLPKLVLIRGRQKGKIIMSNVTTILRHKGAQVITAPSELPVLQAARLMNQHRIGCLVIVDPVSPRRIMGILTERDIMIRLVAAHKDPATTLIRDIMTTRVHCCQMCTSINELRELMQSQRIRHVPVRDEDGLCGLVSIGDLNAAEADGLTATIVAMEEYITRG